MADTEVEIIIKWSGKEIPFTISKLETILNLKEKIESELGVRKDRQKLFGLKKQGKVAVDDDIIDELNIKCGQKFMMMGTKEDILEKTNKKPENLPEIIDEFDIEEDVIPIESQDIYLEKIQKRVNNYDFEIINPPRKSKKLLVLDIDYTLFDHKSVGETGKDLMRPYLHEFLTTAYDYYDIVIWSATNMKWIKAKMSELGVTTHPSYRICFMLDSLAMISVSCEKYGLVNVKPLSVIWGKFKEWDEKNTIMFDDIRRNFIMNPQSGLKIRPFRNAHQNRETDQELLKLSHYLVDISSIKDFRILNHKKWEKFHLNSKRKHSDDS